MYTTPSSFLNHIGRSSHFYSRSLFHVFTVLLLSSGIPSYHIWQLFDGSFQMTLLSYSLLFLTPLLRCIIFICWMQASSPPLLLSSAAPDLFAPLLSCPRPLFLPVFSITSRIWLISWIVLVVLHSARVTPLYMKLASCSSPQFISPSLVFSGLIWSQKSPLLRCIRTSTVPRSNCPFQLVF